MYVLYDCVGIPADNYTLVEQYFVQTVAAGERVKASQKTLMYWQEVCITLYNLHTHPVVYILYIHLVNVGV